MKTKRTVIIVSLVAAILCAGIGFAALNDRLVVSGNVSVGVNEFSPMVFFTDASVVDYSVTNGASSGVTVERVAETSDPADENDKIIITVPNTVLTTKGDKITVEAVIANTSEKYDARVTLNNTTSAKAGLYSVTCTWKDIGGSEPTIIGKNGNSQTVSIVIELLQTPTEVVNNDKFTITYTAEAVD
ncbi:MAG: hypothetical protein IKL59_07960 [Clostridia bacterium]|nr:hypothetical protein [Clostridia bacterium]